MPDIRPHIDQFERLSQAIPEKWMVTKIGAIVTYITKGTTPTTYGYHYTKEGVLFLRVEDITEDGQIKSGRFVFINQTTNQALQRSRLEAGDILVSIAGTIGRTAIVRERDLPANINQALALIRVDKSKVDPRFLYSFIMSEPGQRLLLSQVVQLAQANLSLTQIASTQVFVPPITEQRRIADILDVIDSQIKHTKQLITKLEFQKTGLLQGLLTCGLNEHGQLRDPITHPEQFKMSVLGKIPKEWEIANLDTIILQNGGLIQTGPFGSQLHAHEYVAEGVPVIMPQDIQNGHINETQAARITPERAKILARHYVEFNDVIFARRGDLGRCTFIDTSQIGWICGTGCLLVRPPKSVDGRWLAAIYRHNYSQRQILARAVGSTMVNLNTTLLTDLIVAKPSIAEQVAIVEKIDILDMSIRIEEAYHNKLELYKKSLMQDLLLEYVSTRTDEKLLSKASPLYKDA